MRNTGSQRAEVSVALALSIYIFALFAYIYIYIYSLYLYVPDEGSLLPKYRDCTTSNDFELYIYTYICLIVISRIAYEIIIQNS